MPELPEVEATCSRIRGEVVGLRIAGVDVLRPGTTKPQSPAVIERAVGRTIRAVERRGKNIVLRLSGGLTVRIHLGMTGGLQVSPTAGSRNASTRLVLRLAKRRSLVFSDPRALGRVQLLAEGDLASLLGKLGPEPLSPEFTAQYLVSLARASKLSAKLFLMDQKRIAGLGNIYAAEALFRAGIDPRRPVHRLSPVRIQRIRDSIVAVLRDAVESARKAYARPGGLAEAESFECAVYGREGEPCRICGRGIHRIRQGGRSTYFCPGCQT